ncbi:transposase [Pseudomonas aeruginosa]|nr:transposase [Pseudomonas aeruginosa]AJD61339.1 transposase [Pseudomonas aeruginosa]EKX2412825.1 transposase [Pseudomonas aeruginosa]EKX2423085.1 transposase [Pseudomonas aeruginosa]EKX9354620.1 transposase [Pseudomonas aeruginosa]ELH7022504.1 transposase [Pseudomonas aeruginosa]
MPRQGRVVLPNYPLHVVQRGHNRQVVFAEDEDYQRYLSDLRDLKDAFGIKVYAFCLMTNHVHLLLAPGDSLSGLAQLMKTLAARTTRYRNRLEGRSGTLWESRYKSSVVQSDAYLLACCRYIELNPVRARMVDDVAAYPWSSYGLRADWLKEPNWLDMDSCFIELGQTAEERYRRYVTFMKEAIPAEELRLIREAVQRGQLTGNQRFVDEIERVAGVRIERRGQGRPRLE